MADLKNKDSAENTVDNGLADGGLSSESASSNMSLRGFLAKWAIQNNISQTSLDSLLSGLRKFGQHSELPRSSKTLLMVSARPIDHVKMSDGVYCHIGVKASLLAYLSALIKSQMIIPDNIIIDFNIDGVNFSKSTQWALWIIQMSLRNSELNPFVIGSFYGKQKPACNEFLKPLVDELKILTSNGIYFNQNVVVIEIDFFCNDTPANSFICQTKGHTGYKSCLKCTQKGLYLDSRLVFPLITSADRTNESFRSRVDPEHHTGTSILENIENLDMVRSFPIDEMHIVHLGVMKKIIGFWLKTLSKNEVAAIGDRLKIAEKHRPYEFRRNIRHITEVNQFKAKELRAFLMFTGPLALKDIIKEENYNHFLSLHFGMRKLWNRNHKDIASIRTVIEKFVRDFKCF